MTPEFIKTKCTAFELLGKLLGFSHDKFTIPDYSTSVVESSLFFSIPFLIYILNNIFKSNLLFYLINFFQHRVRS